MVELDLLQPIGHGDQKYELKHPIPLQLITLPQWCFKDCALTIKVVNRNGVINPGPELLLYRR